MRLRKLEIENYHCYHLAEFDFAAETTVLIGKTGSGKSSLIKAIKTALSVFFSNNTKWGYPTLAGSVSDLRVTNLNAREIWHNTLMAPANSVKITAHATLANTPMPHWAFYKMSTANANVQSSYYKEAYKAFMEHYRQSNYLPLMAYYSDRFPHIDTKLSDSIKKIIDHNDVLDRSWGYYHWDYDTSCATIWQKRFMRIHQLRLGFMSMLSAMPNDANAFNSTIEKCTTEIEFIVKALQRFTNSESALLSDRSNTMKIANLYCGGIDEQYIAVVFEDGRRCRWDELPAGYERLLNIVFDLAYRALILNGATHEPTGIAIIDEIDLHLHPTLEQDVLQRLRQAFPKMQFIVTTHSPLVVNSFKQDANNTVLQLHTDYSHTPLSQQYGTEADMVMVGAFQLPSLRNAETQQQIDIVWACLNRNDYSSQQFVEAYNWLKANVDRGDHLFTKIKFQIALIKKGETQ